MAEDGSSTKREMHYTTPNVNSNDDWQSMCHTTNGYSSEDRSNSPLDFSFKRKNGDNEISGSESAPSPASTNDTGIHLDDRKMSNSDNEEKHSLNGHSSVRIKSEPDMNWSMNHNVASMLSVFQAGLIPNPAMLGPLPSVTALMGPRFSQSKSSSTRPFKSYPKEPLMMGGYGHHHSESNGLQNLSMNSEEFINLYRHHMLLAGEKERERENISYSSPSPSQTQSKSPSYTTASSSPSSTFSPNGTRPNVTGVSSSIRNYTSSRKRPRSLPDEQKDESYWERRRKNNEAAKRSRDLRRAKEDEIAIRAALLEQENLKLRVEVAALKTETAKLRCMLYNS